MDWESIYRMAGYLGWAVGFYYAYLVVWTIWRKRRPQPLLWLRKSLVGWASKRRARKGAANWWAVWFAAFFCAVLTIAATRKSDYPIYEYHNVKVLTQVAYNKWTLEREDGTVTLYTGCSDFDNGKVIWAGYVARIIRYEDKGDCNSILKAGMGFYWDRDEHANVRRVR